MTTITFGLHTDSIHHPLVGSALKLSREFMYVYLSPHQEDLPLLILRICRNCPGSMSNLVDLVPLLQILPNRMRVRGEKLHDGLLETYADLIKEIERELHSGKDVDDCVVKSLLQSREKNDFDDLDIAILVSAFMNYGVEPVSPTDIALVI